MILGLLLLAWFGTEAALDLARKAHGLAPAWTATRVAPMEALRQVVSSKADVGALRHMLSWALIGVGAVGLAVCAVVGNQPLAHNGYKVPLMRNLVKRALRAEATS